jgi:hypothetical protein
MVRMTYSRSSHDRRYFVETGSQHPDDREHVIT